MHAELLVVLEGFLEPVSRWANSVLFHFKSDSKKEVSWNFQTHL